MIVIERMPQRIETFRVLAAGDVPLGWLRLARDAGRICWIARTPGDAEGRAAAAIRSFCDKAAAIEWLVKNEPVPPPRRVSA